MASQGLDAAAIQSIQRSLMLLGAGTAAKKLGALGVDETIESFAKLRQANKQNKELAKEFQTGMKGNIDTLMEMEKVLNHSIKTEAESSESKAAVLKQLNSKFLEMGEVGEELRQSMADENVSRIQAYNIITTRIREMQESSRRFIESVQETAKLNEKAYADLRHSIKLTVGTFGLASSSLAAGLTGPLRQMQNLGFQSEATASGLRKVTTDAMLMGISHNEASQFVRRFSNQLITLTDQPLLRASDGLNLIAQHGEILRHRFGMVGEQQVQAVGMLLEMTTNLGQRADQLDFEGLADNIQLMSMMTEHSADEIIKTFSELGKDRNFRGLFLALGENANMTEFLTDSFLELQEATGMSLDEFIKYRRFLAQERQQSAVQRTVQAAFTERLAGMVGTFTHVEMDLIRRGRESFAALDELEQADFERLITRLRTESTEMIMQAQRDRDVHMEHLLRTVFDQTNLEDGVDMMSRQQAGIADALRANRQAVEETSSEEANTLLKINSAIIELVTGFKKSAIAGAATALIPVITAAIKLAMIMPGMPRGGPGVMGGPAGPMRTGRLGRADPTARFATTRALGVGMLAFGTAASVIQGFRTAIETEGTAMVKAFEGGTEALNTLTLGLVDIDADKANKAWANLLGSIDHEDLPQATAFDVTLKRLDRDRKEAIELLEKAREEGDQERIDILKEQIARLQELVDINEENRREVRENFEKDLRNRNRETRFSVFRNLVTQYSVYVPGGAGDVE